MKALLVLTLAAVVAGAAFADDPEPYGWDGCTIAVFFDQDFTQTNKEIAAPGSFPMYMVLLNADSVAPGGIRQIEAGLRGVLGMSQVLEADGMWLGSFNNFRISWPSVGPNARPPLPVVSGTATLAATFTVFAMATGDEVIELGPYNPATISGAPVIWDADSEPFPAGWATGYFPPEDPTGIPNNDPEPWFRPLATVNGEAPVATDQRSLSNVKELFR